MIRKAEEGDAAAIQSLWNHAIRDTLITFNATEKTLSDVKAALGEYDAFLVVEQGGKILGFAGLFPFRSGVGYAHTKEHSIMLSGDVRGQGLGRALMDALMAQARQQNVHSLIAGISGSNPGAIPFHTALGFEAVGRVPEAGRKFGQWHDLILMQKLL